MGKNPLFSFRPEWIGARERARTATRQKRIAWDRMPRPKRRKVAIAAGVSERIADVWAKIRWRDIPEGWKDALIANLGAARNPMKKTRKRKKKTNRRPVRRAAARRKNSRKRNRKLTFPLPVTPAQRRKVKRFLSQLTGKRVKML